VQAPEPVQEVARAVRAAGGRALVVGGWVRDRELGHAGKDLDVEVFGLDLHALERVLQAFGPVIPVGRAFGVLRVKGLDVDFSLPRRDSKVGPGHRGFEVQFDPTLDFAAAARRRDLSMNSMGFDPLTGELLDPHDGRRDMRAGVLRATDPKTFAEDPLRGIRVAQLAARFGMRPDAELVGLCAELDLSELPGERILVEFEKLLLRGIHPSMGLEVLRETGMLQGFPELLALIGVPQEVEWHPEGDVWVHTLMVVDEAARLRDGGADDLALMFGALCHDFGKPSATLVDPAGRVRSPAHDVAGLEPTARFLARMRASHELSRRVAGLVEHHLAPILFVKQSAGDKAYRRLARKLDAAGISFELLVRVATADHFGRTTPEALARQFPEAHRFLTRAAELSVRDEPPRDAVQGRHLLARGMLPGPDFGPILDRCREVQDETGWLDPERILERVLGERG
jgi:tRNA nucleotidyltransferase (CCA-adding enzyme)